MPNSCIMPVLLFVSLFIPPNPPFLTFLFFANRILNPWVNSTCSSPTSGNKKSLILTVRISFFPLCFFPFSHLSPVPYFILPISFIPFPVPLHIYLSLSLPVYLSLSLSIYLSFLFLSLSYLPIPLPIYLFILPSGCFSFYLRVALPLLPFPPPITSFLSLLPLFILLPRPFEFPSSPLLYIFLLKNFFPSPSLPSFPPLLSPPLLLPLSPSLPSPSLPSPFPPSP